MEIDEIESPMVKIEHIYKCCKNMLTASLDEFWIAREIPDKKLAVDVDNLQSIIVYLVGNMTECPHMIAHL